MISGSAWCEDQLSDLAAKASLNTPPETCRGLIDMSFPVRFYLGGDNLAHSSSVCILGGIHPCAESQNEAYALLRPYFEDSSDS